MPQVVRTDTHTGITAEHERKLRRHAVPTGFDPNEDPVVIGLGATAAGGTGCVALGKDATSTGTFSVTLGDAAEADADSAVAIGVGAVVDVNGQTGVALGYASVQATYGVAIGKSANVQPGAASSVAIGDSAQTDVDNSVALGAHATAVFAHSAAVGANARTTAANQVMLGSGQDYVEIPGNSAFVPNGLVLTDTDGSGNRWIVQVTGGAVALSAAP